MTAPGHPSAPCAVLDRASGATGDDTAHRGCLATTSASSSKERWPRSLLPPGAASWSLPQPEGSPTVQAMTDDRARTVVLTVRQSQAIDAAVELAQTRTHPDDERPFRASQRSSSAVSNGRRSTSGRAGVSIVISPPASIGGPRLRSCGPISSGHRIRRGAESRAPARQSR